MQFLIEMQTKVSDGHGGFCKCWKDLTSIPHWTYTYEKAKVLNRFDAERCMQVIRDHYKQWSHAKMVMKD